MTRRHLWTGLAGFSLALLSLAGCGFHLVGRTPLPESMKSAFVESKDQQSDFVQSLRKALLTAGAHPPGDRRSASSVVHILRDEVVRRTLSVSGQNKPNEYEITYYIRFSVTSGSSDEELLPPQDISGVRSYSFDESKLLAKEHEEAILRQAMAHDLADRVIRQLSSL